MNQDQIFANAIKTHKGEINREFISDIIAKDKTNTIRKYLVSHGLMQLAFQLQEVGKALNPAKFFNVNINENSDPKQKAVQDVNKRINKIRKPLSEEEATPLDGYTLPYVDTYTTKHPINWSYKPPVNTGVAKSASTKIKKKKKTSEQITLEKAAKIEAEEYAKKYMAYLKEQVGYKPYIGGQDENFTISKHYTAKVKFTTDGGNEISVADGLLED